MNDVRFELLKLAKGGRILRLEHSPSGLCLEERLDEQTPVVAQKRRWQQVFASLLAQEAVAAWPPPVEPA